MFLSLASVCKIFSSCDQTFLKLEVSRAISISAMLFLVRFSVMLTVLPLKIFFYFKNCIPDILPEKFNDYRPRFTAFMLFQNRWDLSTSLIDTFSRISMPTSFVFSLSLSFRSWIRSQLLLQYYS